MPPKNSSKRHRQLIDGDDEPTQEIHTHTILSDDHRLAIARKIVEYKDIIKGNGKGLQIKNDKIRVWTEIYDHAVSLKAVIPNVGHLRKVTFPKH